MSFWFPLPDSPIAAQAADIARQLVTVRLEGGSDIAVETVWEVAKACAEDAQLHTAVLLAQVAITLCVLDATVKALEDAGFVVGRRELLTNVLTRMAHDNITF